MNPFAQVITIQVTEDQPLKPGDVVTAMIELGANGPLVSSVRVNGKRVPCAITTPGFTP